MSDAIVAVEYGVSMSRTYCVRGDHQVSMVALEAIVAIHRSFIKARGSTFFTMSLLSNELLSREGFLSETLEHLRQNISIGLSRGDEQQVEQNFRCMASLSIAYSEADYGGAHGSKFHPGLAAGYLSSAVKATIPHKMPDVLMEGVRQMGIAAEDHRPVTLVCVENLAELEFDLLRNNEVSKGAVIKQIRENMGFVADLFLEIADTPLTSTHSKYLAPFYSSTSTEAFLYRMNLLANALVEVEVTDDQYATLVQNLEAFSDGSYRGARVTLLKAIDRKSAFVFDIIHWISSMSKLLNAVAVSRVASPRKNELLRSSTWLFSSFTFVPNDQESLAHVKQWNILDAMFETVSDAAHRLENEYAQRFIEVLSGWIFKAAGNDLHELADGYLSLVAIGAFCENSHLAPLINDLNTKLENSNLSVDQFQEVAEALEARVLEAQQGELNLDIVEVAISRLPPESVESALEQLCAQLRSDRA